jgi:alpha-galactosidase
MSLWAMQAAPLIAGHDVRKASAETTALLTNPRVIAIDQDPLGKPGRRVVQRGALEVWTRPLDGNRTAVALFNRGETPARVEATSAELGVTGPVATTEVWTDRSLQGDGNTIAADVEPHGVALLVLKPAA